MPNDKDPAIKWLASLVAPKLPRQFMLDKAAQLLSESKQFHPPFNPQKAKPASVEKIEFSTLSRDGMLIPTENGFIIKLNSGSPKVRQRFTCAHEIGHTFFYEYSGGRPWRPHESMKSYWGEEGLCYEFAEEMLMPQSILEKITWIHVPSIENLRRLQEIFYVSSEHAARRIGRLSLWDCILVLFEPDRSRGGLKQSYIYRGDEIKSRNISWDNLLSKDSSPYLAFTDTAASRKPITCTLKANELFRLQKKIDIWSVESLRLTTSKSDTIVSVIQPCKENM